MNTKPLIALALAIAGTASAGLAQARGAADVQWSVTIGSPFGLPLPPVPIIVARPQAPVLVVSQPAPRRGYGDADRDGIPNRYDRVYNPRWDRDRDGIPNRWDRHDDRRDDRREHGGR